MAAANPVNLHRPVVVNVPQGAVGEPNPLQRIITYFSQLVADVNLKRVALNLSRNFTHTQAATRDIQTRITCAGVYLNRITDRTIAYPELIANYNALPAHVREYFSLTPALLERLGREGVTEPEIQEILNALHYECQRVLEYQRDLLIELTARNLDEGLSSFRNIKQIGMVFFRSFSRERAVVPLHDQIPAVPVQNPVPFTSLRPLVRPQVGQLHYDAAMAETLRPLMLQENQEPLKAQVQAHLQEDLQNLPHALGFVPLTQYERRVEGDFIDNPRERVFVDEAIENRREIRRFRQAISNGEMRLHPRGGMPLDMNQGTTMQTNAAGVMTLVHSFRDLPLFRLSNEYDTKLWAYGLLQRIAGPRQNQLDYFWRDQVRDLHHISLEERSPIREHYVDVRFQRRILQFLREHAFPVNGGARDPVEETLVDEPEELGFLRFRGFNLLEVRQNAVRIHDLATALTQEQRLTLPAFMGDAVREEVLSLPIFDRRHYARTSTARAAILARRDGIRDNAFWERQRDALHYTNMSQYLAAHRQGEAATHTCTFCEDGHRASESASELYIDFDLQREILRRLEALG